MDPLATLADRWREDARMLRLYGHERTAATCERHAEELEDAFRSWQLEELTVAEAAEESGYSKDRLRELVREDEIPDHRPPGSQGEIRIRRCDLPRKPGIARQELSAVDEMAAHLSASRSRS